MNRPLRDPHGGWCGGWGRKTPGYPIVRPAWARTYGVEVPCGRTYGVEVPCGSTDLDSS